MENYKIISNLIEIKFKLYNMGKVFSKKGMGNDLNIKNIPKLKTTKPGWQANGKGCSYAGREARACLLGLIALEKD